MLTSGRALLLFRDVVTGAEQSRVVLRPGESYQWSTDGDSLLREYAPEDFVGVVAHDDIGREFREPEGTLRKILEKWAREDEAEKRSDVEVLVEHQQRPVLTEDADVTLGSLVRSAVQLVEVTASALTSLWTWRRANPQALAQPREQWPDGVAPAQDIFRSYAEGTLAFSPSSWMSHPTVLRRLRAAALDDAGRAAWNTFD